MTNDEGRKPEGAPERSPKAGEGAPSGVDGNGPKGPSIINRVMLAQIEGNVWRDSQGGIGRRSVAG